jgi:3-dehydroquinate synthase
MAALNVKTPEGQYPIVIQTGLLADIGTAAEMHGLTGHTLVITNTDIATLYGEAVVHALPNASLAIMSDGEQYKTLATVEALYGDMVKAGLDRGSTVIALGGGVVGDTAGFAAATYMRGVRLVQIPTSLLAMVDSSVGGKVGVDLPQGKNLAGAFKQPERVLIDPTVLRTLPERELRCGMAELIKHGLIADTSLVDSAVRLFKHEIGSDDFLADLAAMLPAAIQVKIRIVEQDPYEANIRAYLNLGHTFAHAIEQVSEYRCLHGEAVGVGLIGAARLSQRIGLCGADTAQVVEDLVRNIGLPTRIGDMDVEAIYAAMATDKKWKGGRSRFVLLEAIGKPCIVENVPFEDVIAVLQGLQ